MDAFPKQEDAVPRAVCRLHLDGEQEEQEQEEEKAAARARDTDRAGGAVGGGQDTHGDSEKAHLFHLIYYDITDNRYDIPENKNPKLSALQIDTVVKPACLY